ncbi:MAG: hypothetical protein PGN26_01095 [Xylophilus ampelinus]
MSRLLNRFVRILGPRSAALPPSAQGFAGSVAHSLFERAEARSGQDPYQARELREAAHAYLRVLR